MKPRDKGQRVTVRPRLRDYLGIVVAVAGAGGGIVLAPWIDPATGIPAVFAAGSASAVALTWPRLQLRLAWPAALAALVSLTATVYIFASDRAGTGNSGFLGLFEVGGLLTLLALVVRWSPTRAALTAGTTTAAATMAWILRYLPSYDFWAIIGGCGTMATVVAFAIILGSSSSRQTAVVRAIDPPGAKAGDRPRFARLHRSRCYCHRRPGPGLDLCLRERPGSVG